MNVLQRLVSVEQIPHVTARKGVTLVCARKVILAVENITVNSPFTKEIIYTPFLTHQSMYVSFDL